MLGCNRCNHIWDNCECSDKVVVGADRDMFEDIISDDAKLNKKEVEDLGSHYRHSFMGHKIDVYRVIQIFGVTDPVAQHIIKKLLRGEKKGHTMDFVWDEVFQACDRKKEMIKEDEDVCE